MGAGVKMYALGNKLGYKTPSSFQTVTTGNDIRLSVLLTICNYLGYNIIITNNKGVSINVNDYYNEQAKENGQQQQPAD